MWWSLELNRDIYLKKCCTLWLHMPLFQPTGSDILYRPRFSNTCWWSDSKKSVIHRIIWLCIRSEVGKTSRTLKMYCCYRIAEHRSTIRSKNMNYPVAIHFVCSYFLSKMHLNWEGVIPSRRDKVDVLLSRRQHYWIHHLRTLPPHELNIDHDLVLSVMDHHLLDM